MTARTAIESLADFAIGLEHAPDDVLRLADDQLRAVLAALPSGAASEAGAQAIRASRVFGEGRARIFGGGEGRGAVGAVIANGAASMAHDFDDYLFLGHTGHSAVLASLAVADELDASRADMRLAQVAANEVAGRLGGLVAIGPQNGQLWAHIHLAGAVVAAARLRGLDAERCADALAIAFYQPPFSLSPGFMGSEAKVLTAAWPTAQGLLAVELAAEGMRGARDLLEHPEGFGARFSFLALPELLGGLGARWVSRTLSFKRYPGCAYIDGPVDAALAARGDGLDVDAVERVDIDASALSVGMEALCERANAPGELAPIAINFSARRSVAIALVAGELTPRQLERTWLDAHGEAVRRVMAKVHLGEDRGLTGGVLEGIADGFPLAALAREVGLRRAGQAVLRMFRTFEGSLAARDDGPDASSNPLARLSGLGKAVGALREAGAFSMDDADFARLSFRFGADVAIRVAGETRRGSQRVPRGAAGSGDRSEVVQEKLRAELTAHGDPEAADRLDACLAEDPSATPARAILDALS